MVPFVRPRYAQLWAGKRKKRSLIPSISRPSWQSMLVVRLAPAHSQFIFLHGTQNTSNFNDFMCKVVLNAGIITIHGALRPSPKHACRLPQSWLQGSSTTASSRSMALLRGEHTKSPRLNPTQLCLGREREREREIRKEVAGRPKFQSRF